MASTAFPEHFKSITTTDNLVYGYTRVLARSGKPTILFLHGYPSSSYHWLHQTRKCIDAGYGVVAPDLLGYGTTSKPEDYHQYDCVRMSKHVAEILDAEKVPRVIGVGHDWGSTLLSTMIRWHESRFSKLVFTACGYFPTQANLRDVVALDEHITKAIGRPGLGYWLFHNKPEAASVIENAKPGSFTSLLYPADPNIWIEGLCVPGGMESWLKEGKTTERATWSNSTAATHEKILLDGGYTGPLNWYKQAMAGVTHASESALTENYAEKKFSIPTLLVGANHDVVCVPAHQLQLMQPFFENLQVQYIDTAHWCMIEKPDELWEMIIDFVEHAETT